MSIYSIYFSPTGNTKKACCTIASSMAMAAAVNHGNGELPEYKKKNLTRPSDRRKVPAFQKEDIVIVGVPVYGGRIPQLVLETLHLLKGNQAKAVAVVTYGERDYDDALLELASLLIEQDFKLIGACAMLGQHSLSVNVGKGRPDHNDLMEAEQYGRALYQRIDGEAFDQKQLKGNQPFKEYGASIPVEKLLTSEACTNCGICSNLCPTGAISTIDQKEINLTQCIRCHACVRNCPVMAKQFQDTKVEQSKKWLEQNCMIHKKNEFFL